MQYTTKAVVVHLIQYQNQDPHLLLMRRVGGSLDGEWCPVSGGIEPQEPAWATALRECKEETGICLNAFYSADHCEMAYSPQENAMEFWPVFVGFIPADQTVTLNAEHSDYRWLPPDTAMDWVPFPTQRDTIAHVQRHFIQRDPCPYIKIEIPEHFWIDD